MQYSLEFSELNAAPENEDGNHELDEYVTKMVTALASVHAASVAHRTIF